MLSICCEYAEEYNIVFNIKKTVCIKFGDNVNDYEHVYINNTNEPILLHNSGSMG